MTPFVISAYTRTKGLGHSGTVTVKQFLNSKTNGQHHEHAAQSVADSDAKHLGEPH